jgi:hypothetical protein
VGAAAQPGEQAEGRPVVRLPDGGAVLTRVAPGRRETSMLLRARPGWAALRAYLEGQDDQRRCARALNSCSGEFGSGLGLQP